MKEADQYRSAGLSESKAIRSRADLQYERVLSSARADSERIRGTAEAEAIAIRNAAHAKDPEFYVTLRTLETYKKILNEKTTLVLSASSSLLKMLTDGIPRKAPMPERKKDVKSTTGLETP
jgi:membrane protease subunit HflC